MQHRLKSESYTITIILSILVAICVLFVLLFPDQIFTASLQGLKLWWNIVFPAMLPYMILLHLLASFGWIFRFERMLDPLMHRVFHLPGSAVWAIIAGLAAGFPAGAQVVASLRSKRWITPNQAERLLFLSFATSPVIIIHIVAVGMYGDSRIGWGLLIIHWLALAVAGLFYSLHKSARLSELISHDHKNKNKHPLKTDIDYSPSLSDGFGKKLGDAVVDSIQTLMKIGGIIMIFSVIVKACEISLLALLPMESWIQAKVLMPVITAFTEVHLGSYAMYNYFSTFTIWNAIALSSLFAWGGLSGHLQLFGLFKSHDLRYSPFFSFRLLHTACAALITSMLWNPLTALISQVIPVTSDLPSSTTDNYDELFHSWWPIWTYLASITGILLIIFTIVSQVLKIIDNSKR